MTLLDKSIAALRDAAHYSYDQIANALTFLGTDQGFFLFSADVARYIFIATSVLLMIIMVLSRPKNFLDVSLTLREGSLSAIFIIAIIARWEDWILPQWFVFLELVIVSIVGVALMWALVKEYFWTYWNRRSE